MEQPGNIRAQLQSLKIPKDQRPAAHAVRRRGRHWGRWVFLLLVVAAAAGAYLKRDTLVPLVSGLVSGTAKAAEVPLMTVTARTESAAPPVLTATGKIVSDHRVAVATKVSGQITALFFEQGDQVKVGQKLATIEDVLYRARRDEAAAMLAKDEASLEYQKFNHERVNSLAQRKNASDVEQADAARALREGHAQVAASKAALDHAQKALADCVVTAPIAGVVLQRNVEVGDFVAAEGGRGANANAQFGLIADMTKLRVEVDVSELDIARIHEDMPCTVTPEAYKDRRYDGHVMWIDPGADYSKATVQVKVRIENPDDYLRVEGSAQVVFVNERPAGDATTQPVGRAVRVWIPSTACAIDPSGKTAKVFVVRDGQLRETTITMGRQAAGQVEVVAGLEPGQSIAKEGLAKLRDGQRVRS